MVILTEFFGEGPGSDPESVSPTGSPTDPARRWDKNEGRYFMFPSLVLRTRSHWFLGPLLGFRDHHKPHVYTLPITVSLSLSRVSVVVPFVPFYPLLPLSLLVRNFDYVLFDTSVAKHE